MQPPADHPIGGGESAGGNLEDIRARTEQYARQEPLQALGAAFIGGLLLTLLPLGGLIALILRLTLSLIRPALVILGAVKLYEEISRRQR
jgi:hypothetical protein